MIVWGCGFVGCWMCGRLAALLLVLPWTLFALGLVLHEPNNGTRPARRLLASTPPPEEPHHCPPEVLDALPHTPRLLRALASFQAVSTGYFPELCATDSDCWSGG